ncbi:hypothetical protein FRX31_021437 [Thalictrum thalictroides]|uniref:Uncharacterized protein n=1 Tax=Thalictrum thalictroides TaxID=46969 RepID=A0A7J6VV46_THATH|nr:hypothetical protein FRX31_021437 [Thalictrum thalictroides]
MNSVHNLDTAPRCIWDLASYWTFSWRMACTCRHTWKNLIFLIIDSWNPSQIHCWSWMLQCLHEVLC